MLAAMWANVFLANAQETIVQGKVTDVASGDPIPFANVVFKGTSIGSTTDFDGNFLIKTQHPTDTIIASYIGYKSRSKGIKRGVQQTINFQLEEDVTNLQEVVIKAGENPAFEVLRNVVRNKNKNDKRKLTAYEYDTYTKIEIDVDNLTEKFRERKIVKRITQVLDSVVLPVKMVNPFYLCLLPKVFLRFTTETIPRLRKNTFLKPKSAV